MARIVMGNRDGPLALAQARSAISELASEWPDIHLVQKTVPASGNAGEFEALFNALEKGAINIALVSLERLPDTLPEGITLASVTKRLEPRSALIAKGKRSLEQLSDRAAIGVGKIGRASCRERGWSSGGAGALKKNEVISGTAR